jgi:uncharacterized protein YtpQ (UPF0354 family)
VTGRRTVVAALAAAAVVPLHFRARAETGGELVPVIKRFDIPPDELGHMRQHRRLATGNRLDDDEIPAHEVPVVESFVGDLAVVYRSGGDFVDEDDLDRLALSLDEMRAVAIENWQRANAALAPRNMRGLFVLEGELASSILLVPSFWRKAAEGTGGRLVVAVPERDVVVFATDNLRNTRVLLAAINDVHARGLPNPLTRRRFTWREEGWEVVA